jgi:C4-type Zn-finger protein
MSHQGTSSLADSHIDLFRSLLEQHQSALVQRIASQQAQFTMDIDARIDAKINARSAEFKLDMDSFRASMISEVASCTQSAIENMMDQFSDRVSIAVKSEVESLDEKFQTLLDNSSSVHSGSQTSTLSACVSYSSAQSEPRSQKWQCPVCQFDLKHEKSFYDHFALLMSRVHELPVTRGRRRQQKLKKCIFNIDRPEHTLLLQPWAATQPNFWCQAREFVRCLLLMLKPGSEYATRDDNPRHASVFRWIDECRTGVFKPSN